MRVLVLAALIGPVWLGSRASAEDQVQRTFNVLVTSDNPGAVLPFEARATDFSAAIGSAQYAIRGIRSVKEFPSAPILIVLDFASSQPENHPCLIAEAFAAADRLRDHHTITLVAAGTSPGLIVDMDFGKDTHRALVVGYPDPKALPRSCPGSSSQSSREYMESDSGRTLSSIQNGFGSGAGPVRVFWLSDHFGWYDFVNRPPCDPEGPPCDLPPTSIAFQQLQRTSEASTTVFPILFPKRRGMQNQNGAGGQSRAANRLAHQTGGFTTLVIGAFGDTLVQAVEKSDRGMVVTLRGPADRRTPSTRSIRPIFKPKILKMFGVGDSKPFWSRQFVVNAENTIHADPDAASNIAHLIWASDNLGLTFGCSAPGTPSNAGLALALPRELVNSPSGKVEVYVKYLNSGILPDQSLICNRTRETTMSLCIPIAHLREGIRFQIFVVDPNSHWVGAREIVLEPTKVSSQPISNP